MIEALTEPKTWLFALFTIFTSIPNSLSNQLQIIVVSFGFDSIETTPLSCVNGVVVVVAILACVTIVSCTPNSIAWVGMAFHFLAILGVFLVNFLPWRDKVGLLFAVWTTGTLLVLQRADSVNSPNQLLGAPVICWL
jgi:ACS family allantoate permease-like MFS transporter